MRLFSDGVTLHNRSGYTGAVIGTVILKMNQMTATRLNYGKDESKREIHS